MQAHRIGSYVIVVAFAASVFWLGGCASEPTTVDSANSSTSPTTTGTGETAEGETESFETTSKREILMEPDKLTEADWKERLTEMQFYVTRLKGTEPRFQNEYWDSKVDGTYHCVCCNQPLFASEAKYKSGTGWPSFYQPIDPAAVDEESDNTLFSRRTEILCSHCNAHLGHVFPDGPEPTGLRYCMNSASLLLVPADDADESTDEATAAE